MGTGVESWEALPQKFPKVGMRILHNFLSKLFKEWFLEHHFWQGCKEFQVLRIPTPTGSIINNP